jgi:hypothetical protein
MSNRIFEPLDTPDIHPRISTCCYLSREQQSNRMGYHAGTEEGSETTIRLLPRGLQPCPCSTWKWRLLVAIPRLEYHY